MDAPSSEKCDLGISQDRTDGAGLNGGCWEDHDSERRTREAGVRVISTSLHVWLITQISVHLLISDLALKQRVQQEDAPINRICSGNRNCSSDSLIARQCTQKSWSTSS